MPTNVIHVERVDKTPTVRPDLHRYLVTGRLADGRPGGFQAYTLSEARAFLCEQAGQTHHPVVVMWKDSRFGPDIVDVKLLAGTPWTPEQLENQSL